MYDDNMSNEIVNCFNGKECSYDTSCPMYNAALGLCRLEPLKTYKVEGVPEKPKKAQAAIPKPQKHIWKIGESAQPMALSIQKAKPALTLEAIEELIKTEVAKAGGLLTEEAAAYLVASNLGIGKEPTPTFEVGKYIEVTGTLLDDPVQRDIDTISGPVTLANFRIEVDGTPIRVTLWRDFADQAMSLTAGDKVHLTSMKVQDPYDNMTQLSSAKYTKVTQL